MMTYEIFRKKFNKALSELIEKDYDLLEENINENTLASKFTCYLHNEFEGWNVDFGYNRKGSGRLIKRLSGDRVFPDIVIHKRRDDINLLWLEIKKNINAARDAFQSDYRRVKYVTEKEFYYQFGVFLIFNTFAESKCNKFGYVCFEDGKEIGRENLRINDEERRYEII